MSTRFILRFSLLTIAFNVLLILALRAQETSATFNGRLTTGPDVPAAGATVTVKHEPTGTVTTTQSNNKGLFSIPNLRVGGPYTVTISFVGFHTQVYHDVNLALGNNPDLEVSLAVEARQLTEVTVTTGGRRGSPSGLTVSQRQLTTLPTIGRSLSDFTRLTPQSNNNAFAGTNFRYNNITLDGAVNNDAIGFSNSFGGVSGGGQAGTAGSGSRTNPYSLDVIQEVQVQLSPYDVKLGNFTGGSVNAVTRSGTNDFHGSVYGYGHGGGLVGKSVDGLKTPIGSDFYDEQFGATISGPIIRNKLFFIANAEITRHQEPTFYNAGDPGAVSVADVTRVANAYKAAGFDPGEYLGAAAVYTNSEKYFGKLDYTIDNNNSLSLRAIYTYGRGNNIERTNTTFQFTSTDFTQYTKNTNIVAELKSRLSPVVNNDLILSYINVHDYRTFPAATPTPYVDITDGATNIWAGTWREAAVYNTKQKTFELTDNVTWNKGINKFTFGTHNEFYDFSYGFIQSWNGRWQYGNIANFENSHPSRIRGTFALDNSKNTFDNLENNTPGAGFNVGLLSAYAQDEISVTSHFKLSPGVRLDYSYVGNQPYTDPELNTIAEYASANPSYSHTSFSQLNNKWFGNVSVSPRLGFNWDVTGRNNVVIRGGTGIFTGRIPFAWLGYAYTLTGKDFGNIDYNNIPSTTTIPLASPQNLKTAVDAATGSNANTRTRELDIIDNNFKLPSIWRSNIAIDYRFGKGFKATGDVLYTRTLYDVEFQQINLKDQTAYFTTGGPTQSPTFTGGKMDANYSAIYLLSNTTQGYRYNFTAQLSQNVNAVPTDGRMTIGYNWSAAYTYGMSKDISNGIRNSFSSNYEYNPAINPNNPQLAYSNFDLRHRIVVFAGVNFNWNRMNTTTFGAVYTGQSGSPYTTVYTSIPYGTGSSAPLVYIPRNQSDINLRDNGTYTAAQQWADLDALISGDPYLSKHRGEYAERNGLRTPWNHTLDLKLTHEFHLSRTNNQHSIILSADIFNFLNLLNNDWGRVYFVTNTNNYTVNFLKFVADASGKAPGAPATGYTPSFNYLKPPTTNGQFYTTDPLNSRWQMQFGVKYTF